MAAEGQGAASSTLRKRCSIRLTDWARPRISTARRAGGAVEAVAIPSRRDLVRDRADAAENAVDLAGEEVEGDVGHLGDYASLDGR